MFSAKDLVRLIFKLDRVWKCLNSDNSIGNVVNGCVRNSSMSSEYAAYLYSFSGVLIPCMSGLSLSLRRNGSRVSTKRIGDRGHPCLVLLRMGKASDRVPLTLTLAEGFPYNRISPII